MSENKLILETKRYETHIKTLAKLKDMYKHGRYSYFAGSLTVNTPDLIKDEGYVVLDVDTTSEQITDTLNTWMKDLV